MLLRSGVARRWLLVALLLGIVVRSAALPLRGTEDVRSFKAWANAALARGLFAVYRTPAEPRPNTETPDYPPLSVVMLTSTAAALKRVWGAVPIESRAFTAAVKILPLAFDVGVFVLAWSLIARRTHDGTRAAATALAFWLNPAFILNAAVLGYLDVLCWAPGIGALVMAAERRIAPAAVLAACAALIKPQGIFFAVPVVAAAMTTPRGLVRGGLAAGAAALAVVAPFVWEGGPYAFVRAMGVNALDDTLSGNALNVWWLLTIANQAVARGWAALHMPLNWISESTFAIRWGVTPRPWMAALVLAVAARVMWLLARHPDWRHEDEGERSTEARRLALLAGGVALMTHVYCLFAIAVHENHLIYVVAMLGVAAACDRRYVALYAAVSAISLLNMGLFYGIGRDAPVLPRTGWFIGATAMLSLANLGLLFMHARLFAVVRRAAPAHAAPRPRGPAAGR